MKLKEPVKPLRFYSGAQFVDEDDGVMMVDAEQNSYAKSGNCGICDAYIWKLVTSVVEGERQTVEEADMHPIFNHICDECIRTMKRVREKSKTRLVE